MKDEREIYEWNDGIELVGTEKAMKKQTEGDRRRGKVCTYEKEAIKRKRHKNIFYEANEKKRRKRRRWKNRWKWNDKKQTNRRIKISRISEEKRYEG